MATEFFKGKDLVDNISYNSLQDISNILNKAWGTHVISTPNIIEDRLKSDDIFYVTYDHFPVAILETRLIKYDRPELPSDATYNKLTNSGLWNWGSGESKPFTSGDHQILVLVGVAGPGYARSLIDFVLDDVSRNHHSINEILTFTPDIEKLRRWHEGNGAARTDFKVINARPSYRPKHGVEKFDNPKDVLAMSYSLELKKRRHIIYQN